MVLGISLATSLFGCSESVKVSVPQWIEPRKPLPPTIKTIALVPLGEWMQEAPPTRVTNVHAEIAVIVGDAYGDYQSFDVSGPAADQMADRLQEEIDRRGLDFKIVDRETLQKQLEERNLANSDLVNPDDVFKLKGLLPVDAFLVVKSRAAAKVEQVPADTFTIDDVSRAIQSDGNYVRTSQRMSVQRQIEVESSFRLTDAQTGGVHDTYRSTKSQADKARPGFFAGENMAEANLPAAAKVVEDLLERQVEEFIGQLVGIEARGRSMAIAASNNADCKLGVRYLNSESWPEALDAFNRAIAANPSDVQAQFGAGVAAEQMGRYDEALRYYDAALRLKNSPDYSEAVKRVRGKMNRDSRASTNGR